MKPWHLLVSFHFSVKITGFNGPGDSSFSEVSGLESERGVIEIKEGGENRYTHRVPDRAKFGNLVLKRGVLRGGSNLGQWCKSALEGDLGKTVNAKNLDVILLDPSGTALLSWNVVGAWPVKWSVTALAADKNELAVETLELAYAYFTKS